MGSSRNTTSKRHRGDSEEGDRHRKDKKASRSPSPKREKRGKEKHKSPSPSGDNNGEFTECMSIEDTNKLRAKLGLAPLEVDEKPKERIDDDGLKVIVEDGTFEFKHKPSENWGEKKRQAEIKLKIEAAKKKRELETKMFKGNAKGLADSDSDDDAEGWVSKLRKQEDEKRLAAEREKMLNEMDEDFEVTKVVEKNKKPKTAKKAKAANTGGMVIGHSKEAFAAMRDHILVLEDKSVLDEGEETLINPNLIDNERYAKNVELKKRKDPNRNFDEDVDQYGNRKDFGVLSKYDEDLEASKREKFRLDEEGGFDIDKEEREARIRHELEMANKKLVSLDMPNKYTLATEFYTQEEMVAFRKPKKVKKDKLRKRGKMLKADDLIPQEQAGSSSSSKDRGSRRRAGDSEGDKESEIKKEIKEEPGEEMETDDGRWKKSTGGSVDIDRLKKLANRDSDDDSEDEFGTVDLSNVVVEDDARDELSSILEKTRRFKQAEVKRDADVAQQVHERLQTFGGIKMEVDSDGEEIEEPAPEGVIRMDTTSEYCRNIGENLTYGLAGNRKDDIDTTELQQEVEEENAALERWKAQQAEKKERKRQKKMEKEAKGGWREAGSSNAALDSDDERELEKAKEAEYSSSDEDEDGEKRKEYENVLGKEADVSKGVGAMLKLAAQKGYLTDPNAVKRSGQNLDHLRIQAKTQVEATRFDIEDKYMKKLDRLGTTGRGPLVAFCEKKDYNPEVNVSYVDNKGRVMEAKDAYRELSYKFHGRKPGKKQSEKRVMQREKKELLKQMNSSDTPLGTLSKQLNKQKQLQTPYLVLSGSGRSDHTSIKKE